MFTFHLIQDGDTQDTYHDLSTGLYRLQDIADAMRKDADQLVELIKTIKDIPLGPGCSASWSYAGERVDISVDVNAEDKTS